MSHFKLEAAHWALALVVITACTRGDSRVHIEHVAFTRDVLGADVAGYFTVRLDGSPLDSVAEVSLAEAQIGSMQTVQAHRSTVGSNSLTMMMPVGPVPIGPTGIRRFAPGGYTAVFYGMRRPLVPGDSVTLTVTMTTGRKASVVAPILVYDSLEAALNPTSLARQSTDAPTAMEGARLYRANGCASCHGPEGRGDGPVGQTLVPPPRDFRLPTSFKSGTDAQSIARTLAIGMPAGGSMPLFAHLTNHERRALALYLVSLRTSLSERSSTP